MAEDDGGRAPSTSASTPISGPEAVEGDKGRSCRGCLLYSSTLRDARRNPICIGLGRTEPRVYSLVGDSDRDAAKEGRRLADFKYACIGYSIHKEATASSDRPIDTGELPLCVGVEFLADRRPQAASSPTPLEQLEQNDEGPPVMPRPPSAVRQPTTIGGMSGDEFASRFIRCAGLVASAVVRNVSHLVTSIKTGVDDMVHDRRRPK
ncbi:unnamed protein product [Calypogeia fissa]